MGTIMGTIFRVAIGEPRRNLMKQRIVGSMRKVKELITEEGISRKIKR
jgi:hypothetical protein